MRRIRAIALIAIRNSVRSRVVVLLLAVLLLAVIGLPMTIKDDGTLAGRVQIQLGYTLGAATLILSLATLWAGCGAVSLEIQGRQIQLLATKPVNTLEVWLGKWLGLMILNAALLAVSGLAAYSFLRRTTRVERLATDQRAQLEEKILTARRTLKPEPVAVDAAAREDAARARAEGRLAPGVSEEEYTLAARHSRLIAAFSVEPNGTHAWTFDLPREPPPGHPLLFRFRHTSSQVSLEPIAGQWRIGRRDSSRRAEIRQSAGPEGAHSFLVDLADVPGSGPLEVEYRNVNPTPVTVLFDLENSLELLVHAGRFEPNLVRALLVILAHLGFLAAVSITAGSLFSMPVAAFASFSLLLTVALGAYVQPPASGHGLSAIVLRLIGAAVRPLQGPNALDLVAAGQLVSWSWLGTVCLVKVVLYGGVLALAGSWLLSRRQLALPTL